MSMDRNMTDKIDWKQILVTTLISAPISAFIMIIFSKSFKNLSINKLVVFFIIFLVLICIILLLLRIPKWIKSRKLLLKVLPSNRISIPVDGRDLSIVVYNKNKDCDINVNIKIEFPEFLKIYKASNYSFNFENETLNEDEELEELEKIEKTFEKEIKVESMNEYRITFKLIPEKYGKRGYIRYEIYSGFKNIENKIEVNT